MAAKIRLQRVGKRSQPMFRIVVIEESKKLKGEPVEVIGWYTPVKKTLSLDVEKYDKWIKMGAQPSDTVRSLYKRVVKKQKVESEIISAITSK
jgi:small subunit ribosomal protein S16